MAASSKGAVLGALVGNSLLTIFKFVAFGVSGSGAMFSEAMHSFADTANQTLLFIGIRSSERPADAMFPYGYGGDRYLFSLLSAVGIFVLGCGVTLYHGVHSLLHPEPVGSPVLPLVVLGVSFVVDGVILGAAIRAANTQRGDKGFFEFLRTTTDPTIAAVLLEDSVACLGVVLAAVAVGLTHVTGNPLFDSLGAIAIGGMLGLIAIWLGVKNRTLLLGPSISKERRDQLVGFMNDIESVKRVRSTKTRIVGAQGYRLQADLEFDGAVLGRKLSGFVKEHVPDPNDDAAVEAFAAAFGERVIDGLGDEVDAIEKQLEEAFPKLRHVDLEAD